VWRARIATAALLALSFTACGENERGAEPTPLPRVVADRGPETDIGALPTVAPPPGLRRDRQENDGGDGGTGGIVTQTPTATSTGTTTAPVTPTATATQTETRGPGE
jgi:hypothetical protein